MHTRLAGYCAVGAAIAMPISGVALWLFFAGAGNHFGPINDMFIALALLLLAPAAWVYRRVTKEVAGGWFTVGTYAGLAGIGLAAAGQLLLVAGVINLETSFVTFGVGTLGFLAWGGSLALLALRTRAISGPVGWLFLSMIALLPLATLLAVAGGEALPLLSGIAVALAFEAWLLRMAADLLRR